jgi:hypothetical protein
MRHTLANDWRLQALVSLYRVCSYTLSFISLYSASVVNVQFRERGGHSASANRAQLGRVRGLLVFIG